jgi:hypothetical protein
MNECSFIAGGLSIAMNEAGEAMEIPEMTHHRESGVSRANLAGDHEFKSILV